MAIAQYDVYPNPSHCAKQGIPWVVVVQSATPLPTRQLKKPVDNIALQSITIEAALDMVLSGV